VRGTESSIASVTVVSNDIALRHGAVLTHVAIEVGVVVAVTVVAEK
jgi:hypothetical protein